MWTVDEQNLTLPALSTAHSHAFQRGMRGMAQRRGVGTFWTWRHAMYEIAESLTPESFEKVTRVAFRELANAGVRTVGEFHYIHHQANGDPYADRTLLSKMAVEIAKEEGLRIALLRCAYFRAGPGLAPERGQKRFCDPSPDLVIRDVEDLRALYANDPDVVVGLAPHSTRAVPPNFLAELVRHANEHALPLHMHVSEQEREVAECVQETGLKPVELLADLGALSQRFVAVHATCLSESEVNLLGQFGAMACLCPTTERDLGDGLGPIGLLRQAGVQLCTGIDSHVVTDPLEDLRGLETHERLRVRARTTFAPQHGTPAEQLWREGSIVGAKACGFEDAGGTISIPLGHPSLALVPAEVRLDAVVFGLTGKLGRASISD